MKTYAISKKTIFWYRSARKMNFNLRCVSSSVWFVVVLGGKQNTTARLEYLNPDFKVYWTSSYFKTDSLNVQCAR